MDDNERDEPAQAPPADADTAVPKEAQDAAEQELEYPADETDEG